MRELLRRTVTAAVVCAWVQGGLAGADEIPVISPVSEQRLLVGAPFPYEVDAAGDPPALFTVEFSTTEGGSVTKPGEGTFQCERGQVLEVEATPDEGYMFTGWSGLAVSIGYLSATQQSQNLTVVQDCAAVAHFKPTTGEMLTLTVSSTEGGQVHKPGEGVFSYMQGTSVTLIAFPHVLHQFISWTGSAVDAGKVASPADSVTTVVMDGDYTLQANFVPYGTVGQYTLTISTTAGGYVSYPGMGARPVYAGTTTEVRAEAAVGYRFTGWTGTAVDAGAVEDPTSADTRVTVDADYTLTANFVPEGIPTIQHTLTVSSGKGGCVVNPGEGAFQFNENAHVVIQAVAESGYRFTGWTGTAVSAGKVADPASFYTTVLMTADFTLTANFERTSEVIYRYLTVTSTEGGRASWPGEGLFTYPDGVTVTLTAKADPGYRFSGWTGSAVDADKVVDSFSPETIVAMDGNYTVQANFVAASQDSSSLLILRPNGGEKLASGSTTTIAWQDQGAVSFDLELSIDDGVTWTQITQCAGRSYSWKVPALSSDRCLIRVRIADNPAIYDDSDATFSIYTAASRIWYVDAAAKGARNGTSWANAFIHLQDAVSKAISGDSILVAEGVYRPDLGGGCKQGDRTVAFQLADGIGIFGGFPAGGGNWSVRNPTVHKSILSGDLGASGVAGDNSYHVVVANNAAKTAVLDGCVICDGYADGDEPHDRGAGLYNLSGSPQIRNCMFLQNYASNGGGACNLKGSPMFVNCIFTANSAGKCGGGLYNLRGEAAVVNCTLTANQGLWRGGGVFNAAGTLTVANSILWGNGRQFKSSYDEWAQASGDVQFAIAYCCIQGWTGSLGGEGSFGDDPLFVREAGPDAAAGTLDDDLRLSNGSPCIDAGNALAVPSGIATDIEGKPRMLDHVDIGAYEFDAGK